MTIQSFINNISPSSDEIAQISTSGGEIRDTIQSKLGFVSSSFLTGSYIRKTKISPIDDLDIFFMIKAGNTSIDRYDANEKKCKIYLNMDSYNQHPLKEYSILQNNRYYVSPNKIMNEMKAKIQETYSTTPNIKRNGECVTVYLSSYDLSIDCVPYIAVKDNEYLLIPTSGNDLYRKKTNPDKDLEKINELNDESHFNGKLKGVIKTMKYWNENKNSGVSFRSYVLECIIYHGLINLTTIYNSSYTEILKQAIKYLYNKSAHNILDIPGYDYIHYQLTQDQRIKIKSLLQTLWDKLNDSEDAFTDYLQN